MFMDATPISQTSGNLPSQLSSPANNIRLAEIIGALSTALDLTEGQPAGHAARTCILGMTMAQRLGLSEPLQSALFYALLLKDLGCSSNAAKMSYLFGADDRILKHDIKTIDWQKMSASVKYVSKHVKPEARTVERVMRMASLALQGPKGPKELVKIRCERGANIARQLGFAEATAEAILDLDEHWNGQGHPLGKRGEEICLLGRILGICQTIEVFWREHGLPECCQVVISRSGRWFDPNLVQLFQSMVADRNFVHRYQTANHQHWLVELEPVDQILMANEQVLDDVAMAFSQVVDAKSPWTAKHSVGVATIADGMAEMLGMTPEHRRHLYRTALLHDLGKLGVSNLILDKPGKMTDEEFESMKQHPRFSEEILSKIGCFQQLATHAGAHHERLDGRGYYRGIASSTLDVEARILMVADVFEALSAARPYRDAMPRERVMGILQKDSGVSVCPVAFSALEKWLDRQDFTSRADAQFAALDRLVHELNPCSSPTGCC